MSPEDEARTTKSGKAGAGVAGAGGGTLVALLATSLDDNNSLREWLIYAAPTVSVGLSGIWLWLQGKVVNRVRDREARGIIEDAKLELEAALLNPNTSDEHKDLIRKKLEEFELVNIDRVMKKLQSLEHLPLNEFQ